jgi:hypothetical protein
MCYEGVPNFFENSKYVKPPNEGIVCSKSDLQWDGGIANPTHISKEYGALVQFRCIYWMLYLGSSSN